MGQNFVSAIFYLDGIVSGGDMSTFRPTKSDVFILEKLINKQIDGYIYDNLNTFIQNKKEIILDLYWLNDDSVNDTIRNLLFYPLEKMKSGKGSKRKKKDFTNLFRSELLSLFPNAESMIIQSVIRSFSMSMTNLLSLISSSNLKKIIIKTLKNKGKNWIETLWKSEERKLIKQYTANDYCISCGEEKEGTITSSMAFFFNRKEMNIRSLRLMVGEFSTSAYL